MRALVSAIRSSSGVQRASDRAARLIRRERTRLLANGLNTLAMSSIAAGATTPLVAALLGVPTSISAGVLAAAVALRIGSGIALHLAARYVVGGLQR